jgi:hypothetical protein
MARLAARQSGIHDDLACIKPKGNIEPPSPPSLQADGDRLLGLQRH